MWRMMFPLRVLLVLLVPLLLLSLRSEAQYYSDVTPAPDYDSDYNATFEYSFFSNASSEDLDRFSEGFIDDADEDPTDTGGQEEEVIVTTATAIKGITERGGANVDNAASLPISQDIRMLLWTLTILMLLNAPQL